MTLHPLHCTALRQPVSPPCRTKPEALRNTAWYLPACPLPQSIANTLQYWLRGDSFPLSHMIHMPFRLTACASSSPSLALFLRACPRSLACLLGQRVERKSPCTPALSRQAVVRVWSGCETHSLSSFLPLGMNPQCGPAPRRPLPRLRGGRGFGVFRGMGCFCPYGTAGGACRLRTQPSLNFNARHPGLIPALTKAHSLVPRQAQSPRRT